MSVKCAECTGMGPRGTVLAGVRAWSAGIVWSSSPARNQHHRKGASASAEAVNSGAQHTQHKSVDKIKQNTPWPPSIVGIFQNAIELGPGLYK